MADGRIRKLARQVAAQVRQDAPLLSDDKTSRLAKTLNRLKNNNANNSITS